MSKGIDFLEQRRQKLRMIEEMGHDPYPHRYAWTHTVRDLVRDYSKTSAEELEANPVEVRLAGRIMALRGHGKASFGHLAGWGERIQFYVREDRVGEEVYRLFRLLDVGDLIGIHGRLLRTRTQELTVFADGLQLLAKSLLPLPEKWHGLADVEIRYRQRYLDLIANPEVREIFVRRSRLIAGIRRFLDGRGYLEVETPMMQPIAGGAAARPFKTYHEALDCPLYLRIAPELYLKRLVVGGFDRVYEINRNFRNEGISTQHNPEFTMLEFYQAYSDYGELMDLTEELLQELVRDLTGGLTVEFRNHSIDFGRFHRYTMVEAIRAFWEPGEPPALEELMEQEPLAARVRSRGLSEEGESWGELLALLFEEVVEPRLVQPTFIYDFPAELSPLAKRKDSDPRLAERFELFVGGLEIANAYSELNDPDEQRRRFEEQLQARARGDLEAHEMDEDYVRALQYGMPPAAGEGIGIDRLTMVLTNSPSIREVILFPLLRPQDQEGS